MPPCLRSLRFPLLLLPVLLAWQGVVWGAPGPVVAREAVESQGVV
jgi:hypothetical protein